MKPINVISIGLLIPLILFVSFSSGVQYDPIVYQAQKALKIQGYDPGPVDGLWGKSTESAVKHFQVDNELPVTGKLDEQTKAKLSLPSSTRSLKRKSQSVELRFALLIGNSTYAHGGSLRNPINDVRDMNAALKRFGFETLVYEDCNQKKMKRAIDDFGKKLKNYRVGLFFYAGHGVQVDGENYLIPVDARLNAEEEVEYDCVRADRILAKMEAAGSKTNIVILDACRDNPFERSWRRGSKGSGLAFMKAPSGSLIAYATAPGRTAHDGTGKNGLYTAALLSHIGTPNISILEMFQGVRSDVIEKTNNEQIPWESTSLTGNFYFTSGDTPVPQTSTGLSNERAKLDRERQELERLKLDIERKKLEAEKHTLSLFRKEGKIEKGKKIYNVMPVKFRNTEYSWATDIIFRSLANLPDSKVISNPGKIQPSQTIVSTTFSRLQITKQDNPEYAAARFAKKMFGSIIGNLPMNIPKTYNIYDVAVVLTARNNETGETKTEQGISLIRHDAKTPRHEAMEQAMNEAFTEATSRLTTRLVGGIPPPARTAMQIRSSWKKKPVKTDEQPSGK